MAYPYDKSFDDILKEILVSYANLDSNPDVTQGSMPYIMGSVLASMIWGLYRYDDYIAKQCFPDTADTEHLNQWGSIYGLSRVTDETDAAYLARILQFLRFPPAGGNALDFKTWVLDQDECYYDTTGQVPDLGVLYNKYAQVVPNGDGYGTVKIYLVPNNETIIDNPLPDLQIPLNTYAESLRTATETYVLSVQPLGIISTSVEIATFQTVPITATLHAEQGITINLTDISDAIEAELNSMEPGQVLYRSKLVGICMDNGCEYADFTLPATEKTELGDGIFVRPGTITLTEE